MKAKHLIAAVLILGLLVSCQFMRPKASPDMIAQIMGKAEKIRFSPGKKLGKSKQGRMDLKAGQWVSTLTTHKDSTENVVLATTRVIKVSGSTVVLEMETYSALEKAERNIAQITFENFPVKGLLSYNQSEYDSTIKSIKVVKVVMKKGNEPAQEIPEQVLMFSQNMGKDMAAAAVRTGDLTTLAYKTDYLESALCYSYSYTVSVMGITRTGKSICHSEIPVNGLVHMDSEDMIQETIAFGTSGATSQL